MGASEYSEDVVVRIDTPLLNILEITFFRQFAFHTSQLAQFISRRPKFKTPDKARVDIYERNVWITLPQGNGGKLELGMSFLQPKWAAFVSGTALQLVLCSGSLFHRGTTLSIYRREESLLIPGFVPRIADALQILAGESVTEVLHALRALLLDEPGPSGSVQEKIGQFVAARQFVGQSIAVSLWKG